MGLAGLSSSIEIVNAPSITDTTMWCEGTATHVFQEGTVHSQEELLGTPKKKPSCSGNGLGPVKLQNSQSCSPSFLSEAAVFQPQLFKASYSALLQNKTR